MRRPLRRARTERGAAAVEFGLIAPLLLLIVFGIADFGYMLLKSHLVNNVARDGVRMASLSGTLAEVDTIVDAELADAGIDQADAEIEICAAGSCGSGFDTAATSGAQVAVTITYTHEWITPFGSLCGLVGDGPCVGDTITIERTASMVRE